MAPDEILDQSTATILAEATDELAEVPVVEEAEVVETPEEKVDWESKANELETQAESLRQQFAPYAKMMQDMEEASTKELVDAVANIGGETPLTETQRSELTGLLRDATQYRRAAPTIQSEHSALAALAHAFTVAGPNATAKDVMEMAQELTGLGDIRLMEPYVNKVLKPRVGTKQAGTRQAVAQQRRGIDLVPASTPGSGSASDEASLTARVNSGLATAAEENRLRQIWFNRDGH